MHRVARELKAAGWRLKEVTTDNGSDELPRKLGVIAHNVPRTRWEGAPVAKRCHLIPTPGAALVPFMDFAVASGWPETVPRG